MSYEREGGGMTDMQFKAYMLDQLENWQRIVDLATAANAKEIQAEAEKQVKKFTTVVRL